MDSSCCHTVDTEAARANLAGIKVVWSDDLVIFTRKSASFKLLYSIVLMPSTPSHSSFLYLHCMSCQGLKVWTSRRSWVEIFTVIVISGLEIGHGPYTRHMYGVSIEYLVI